MATWSDKLWSLSVAATASLLLHLIVITGFSLTKNPPVHIGGEPLTVQLVDSSMLLEDPATPIEAESVDAALGQPEPAMTSRNLALPAEPGRRVSATNASMARPRGRKRWRARLRDIEKAYRRGQAESARQELVFRTAVGEGSVTPGCTQVAAADKKEGPKSKSLGRLAAVLPDGLMPAGFWADVRELSRETRGGKVVFKLLFPPRTTQVRLDAPVGVLILLGSPNTACVVDVEISSELFPITFRNLPVQVVDDMDRVTSGLVAAQVNVDASVTIAKPNPFSFDAARLRRGDTLADAFSLHRATFRLFRDVEGIVRSP